jgi:alkanesulfonate monooxygenase SsuD/methylene tetrahydromethanopterin reductase-like flavin-dependent oxidoreductase (luciferase family)
MPFPQAGPYPLLAERMRRAEEMGFDSVWVADDTPMEYPGVTSFEAWSLLGALARETERVTLGSLVSPVAFRHPMLLAMAASTVDHASNGRVIVGVGTGGGEKDEAGFGIEGWTPGGRLERLAEELEILDLLLRGETVTRSAGHYRLSDAFVERPIQRPRPPILIAAQGPKGIALVARLGDIWNSMGGQPISGDTPKLPFDEATAATRRQVDQLEEACTRVSRDPSTIRRSVFVWRYDALASDEALAEYVGRYRELGFDEFILMWPHAPGSLDPSPEREELLERLAREVFPRLRAADGA